MLPQSPSARRLWGGAAVVLASLLSVFCARGLQKPYAPDAPAYRQMGPAQAKVVIVAFSDFQCPACSAALGPMKKILSLYGKDVRVIFKYYPLERIHLRAHAAAQTAECAGKQGKFWEMHDLFFERQTEWTVPYTPQRTENDPGWPVKYAAQLGLDTKALAACVADPAIRRAIDADIKEGNDQWVGSTPTFFINGKRFVGARQLSTLGTFWIEKQLKK